MDTSATNRNPKPAAAPQSGVYSSLLGGGEIPVGETGELRLTYTPLAGDPVVRVRCEGILSQRGLAAGGEPLRDLLGPKCYGLPVMLNMEKVIGAETSGISWIVQTAEKFVAGGGRLVLFAIPPQVTTVFHMLEMDLPFSVVVTEAEAVALVTRQPGQPS